MRSHRSEAPTRERATRRPEAIDRAWLEDRALRYVARWESSAGGVAQLLERKVRERCARSDESPEEALRWIPAIVERLVERGFVDDRRFAATTLERLRRQGRSSRWIRASLISKGVEPRLVEALLASEEREGESAAAWRLARRKKLGPYCEDAAVRAARRDRHLGVLGRNGFDLELARRIVDADAPPSDRR
jgi:regulatory protein